MGKIKFNEIEYDLILKHESDDELRLSFLAPKSMTIDEIETDISGVEKINILDDSGDVVEIKSGYIYLVNITKDNGRTPEKVTTSSIKVTLKKSDMRQELDEIREVQNMILISMLEG